MRVVFLTNPCFGYLYTYAFDPSALGDLAYAVAEQERNAPKAAEEARTAPTRGESLLKRLAAWLSRREEGATC